MQYSNAYCILPCRGERIRKEYGSEVKNFSNSDPSCPVVQDLGTTACERNGHLSWCENTQTQKIVSSECQKSNTHCRQFGDKQDW